MNYLAISQYCNKLNANFMQNFIHRLILEQGNVDLEWLREVQPEKAK